MEKENKSILDTEQGKDLLMEILYRSDAYKKFNELAPTTPTTNEQPLESYRALFIDTSNYGKD